jgi:hypothetical protein
MRMFGADPFPPKSLLATTALGLAGVQVLLALWIYRKLPLAGSPPRPVPVTHRVTGFAVFALTIPVAVHCLIVNGVQLTSPRVAGRRSGRRGVRRLPGVYLGIKRAIPALILAIETARPIRQVKGRRGDGS